jgi:hypothetical protein
MKLDPVRIKPTDHEVTDFSATVEVGVTPEQIFAPEFFANVAPRLTPYSKIRVRTDDGSWYMELLVLSVGRTWAKCVPLLQVKLTTEDVDMSQAEDSDKYKVLFRGPHLKWAVTRKQDGEVLRDQLETKHAAESWLREYIKA